MAKFITDEGIATSTIKTVRRLGQMVLTLKKASLLGSDDADIFGYAKDKGPIITIDRDFGELYYFNREYPADVIVVRAKPPTADAVTDILISFLKSSSISDVDLTSSLVILSKWRARIIRNV